MNETNEIILELLKTQIMTGNLIDDEYINQVISSIIAQENLEEYAQISHAYTKQNGILYFPNTRTLNIRTARLKGDILKRMTITTQKEKIAQYLMVTKNILNELEYIKLLRDCNDSSKKDLQTKILRMSYNRYITIMQNEKNNRKGLIQLEKYWNANAKYTSLAPERRIAGIASYDAISNIIDGLSNIIDYFGLNEEEFLDKKDLHRIILSPYEIVREKTNDKESAPTYFYLKELGYSKREIEALIKESENIEEIEALRLGLSSKIEEKMNASKRKRVLILPEKNCYYKNSMIQ